MNYQERRLQRVVWTYTGFTIIGIAVGFGFAVLLGFGDTARSASVGVCAVLGVGAAVAYLLRSAD
ncbi:hypothetical protein [Streptomyces sp. BA2]|uniref:hypothetical protein n=1 Tax=Streptomyces sp. BA2 TaxID=436595 RepID=UPI0013269CDF|nr:hypothetical protein [Streptomyces sp. BA2]MWA11878.1 hypothetical protein [Streptomyces sp. BA2]